MRHKILALPGDGIGQEVMDATLEVLDFLTSQESLDIELTIMPVGGTSYDQHGVPVRASSGVIVRCLKNH